MALYGDNTYLLARTTGTTWPNKEGYFVTHGGGGIGSVDIIWGEENGGPETLFASGQSGIQTANWITTGSEYDFVMRAQSDNNVVKAVVRVTRKSTHFLRVEPQPILLSQSADYATRTRTTATGQVATARSVASTTARTLVPGRCLPRAPRRETSPYSSTATRPMISSCATRARWCWPSSMA